MSDFKSTTEQGNSFRDSVAALLRAAHYENVVTEAPIGSKKVDVYFEEKGLTSPRRIAVECKDYGHPLTKTQISHEIVPDYQPLFDSRLIDAVLIVGRVALNADALRYLEDKRVFEFMTYTQLQNRVMDFGSYLFAMRAQFHEQGLDKYYVKPKFETGADVENDLEQKISSWLTTSTGRPIAILAGYGMGKTTFARYIASLAAIEHGASSHRRIPVLIKLGEISNEQGLEGLLGKVFTASNVVRNYHFDLFMELNRLGRLFVILDGFDEMKHTMSWSQFKYNFSELNRLVVPNSKVLLLGRPSAFLSDAEHYLALRGVRIFGSKQLKEPGWPEYEELRISEFTTETAYTFMASYMRYALSAAQATGANSIDEQTATDRLAEVRNIGYEYLIGRPVQARMLAEIAADETIPLRDFSRFELYQIFITRLIEREHEKKVRRGIEPLARRLFLRNVAWWLWTHGGSSGFTAEKLPRAFIARFADDEEHESDALKRELLAGSILEKKAGDTFYFAHRSFLEFLVAEHIASHAWTTADIHLASAGLTPEVARFLQEGVRSDQIASWAELLSQPKGPLKLEFLDLIGAALASEEQMLTELPDEQNPLLVVAQVLGHLGKEHRAGDKGFEYAIRVFSSTASSTLKLLATVGALLAARAQDNVPRSHEKICALILGEAVDEFEEILGRTGRSKSVASDNVNDFARIVISSFKRIIEPDDAGVELVVDMAELLSGIEQSLRPVFVVDDLAESLLLSSMRVRIESLGGHVQHLGMRKKGAIIARFFKQYPDPSRSVVPVSTRRLPAWARPKN